jgi:hypothetical protein
LEGPATFFIQFGCVSDPWRRSSEILTLSEMDERTSCRGRCGPISVVEYQTNDWHENSRPQEELAGSNQRIVRRVRQLTMSLQLGLAGRKLSLEPGAPVFLLNHHSLVDGIFSNYCSLFSSLLSSFCIAIQTVLYSKATLMEATLDFIHVLCSVLYFNYFR